MLEDRYGNIMTTDSDTACAAYIEGVDHILAATFGAREAFETALEADPEFGLAEAGLARALMYEGDMSGAKAAIGRAVMLKPKLAQREKQHVDIFEAMLSGKPVEARKMILAHVIDHPRDALAAQACTNVFGLIGFSGCPGREADLLAYTAWLTPHYGEDWWMMSMHSLSLCETGHTGPALALMERSLELNNSNANGSHFKSHAQYEAGLKDEGLAYLQDWIPGYDRRGILHGHLSWHLALWALHQDELDLMWQTVDTAIAPGMSESLPINVLTDTAALFWRAELAGVDVTPERWKSLSDYAAKTFPAPGQSFADIHAALSHAVAGEGSRLAKLAEATNGYAGDLVAPVARGWRAIAAQNWIGALEELTPVMADHARLGGSRAQRDLLELTYLNVLMKLGRGDEAQRMIKMRRPVFDGVAPVAGLYG